jgi:hypothetical protein
MQNQFPPEKDISFEQKKTKPLAQGASLSVIFLLHGIDSSVLYDQGV